MELAVRLTDESGNQMKYMLMMHCPKTGYEQFGSWPKNDLKANIAFMIQIDKELRASGELVYAEGLASPHESKIVRAGNDGAPVIDSSCPESKEFLAGYLMVDVESAKRACEIAAIWSAAPGPGGLRLNMPIEVRRVMGGGGDELA